MSPRPSCRSSRRGSCMAIDSRWPVFHTWGSPQIVRLVGRQCHFAAQDISDKVLCVFHEGTRHVTSMLLWYPGHNRPPGRLRVDIAVRGGGRRCREAPGHGVARKPGAEKDPFEVPDGTIEELQKYIDGLNKIQPSSSLRPAVAELHKKRAAARLKACEKILAAKPDPGAGPGGSRGRRSPRSCSSAGWAMRRRRPGSKPRSIKSRSLA